MTQRIGDHENPDLPMAGVNSSLIQYSLNSENYLDQLVPLMKTALKSGTLEDFINELDDTTRIREEELQSLSFKSADDILASVESISKVQDRSADIQQHLQSVSQRLSSTGLELSEKKKILVSYKKLHSKINETTYILNSCLEVLDRTNKIVDLIKQENYYNALKKLEDLSNVHLPEIENFEFTKRIFNSIPSLRNLIQESSFSSLSNWLKNDIEKNWPHIGRALFENMIELNDDWKRQKADDPSLKTYRINSSIERCLRSEVFKSFDPLRNRSVKIDLTPVYNAIIVFQTLEESEKLRDDYNKEWNLKRERLLSQIPMDDINANGYGKQSVQSAFKNSKALTIFLQQLAGFLIMDKVVNSSTEYQLRTRQSTLDMYDSLVTKLVPILLNHVRSLTTEETLIDAKESLGIFIQILEDYDYEVSSLYKVLVTVFRSFVSIKTKEFEREYGRLTNEDNLMPVHVDSERFYRNVVAVCYYPFKYNEVPKTLPFSTIYPTTCVELRKLIKNIYVFLDKYYSDINSEVLVIIESALDDTLVNVILKDLKTKVNSTIREELSQSLINMEFFMNSVHEIEAQLNYSDESFLANVRTSSASTTGALIKLKSHKAFQEIRKETEDNLFALVDTKVNDLMDFAEWDWDTKQLNTNPTDFVQDIGQFLQMMFASTFSNLPHNIKSLLLIRTFDLLADHFMTFLKESPFYTAEAIANFDRDVTYIESIINSLNDAEEPEIAQNEEATSSVSLQSMFMGLRQLINLLREGDLDGFKEDSIRMRKFNTIKPDEAILFMKKLDTFQETHLNSLPSSPQPDSGSGTNHVKGHGNGHGSISTLQSVTGSGRFKLNYRAFSKNKEIQS
ncbi:unnamed protein product [Kuraishia capsulata CBS 1993]|uniref:Exocyst complex component SEC15 n=1 Tax=Kuraishia capsulata CBS 1993 TaxID=1382522 RepID=W6MSS9_9ASCO|nr:uncharacterized protein KUCA_T00005870001 [Kuraishia capsulata CBS 1993]CDK29876.1 unnamed protein product [Kuraishia capsulata CBS 1993]